MWALIRVSTRLVDKISMARARKVGLVRPIIRFLIEKLLKL